MTKTEVDPEDEVITKAIAMLGEHWDTVRIFANRHDADSKDTVSATAGCGNVLSQKAQVQDWLTKVEIQLEEGLRASVEEDDDE